MKDFYRILGTADIHMSNRLPYAQLKNDQYITDRLQEQLGVFEQIYYLSNKMSVDSIYILGDLFDQSKVDAVTLTQTVKMIKNRNCPIHILPGNHETSSINGGKFIVDVFGELKDDNIILCNKPYKIKNFNISFWPIPYTNIPNTRHIIEDYKKKIDNNDVNILLIHNNIIGAKHLGWICDDGLNADEICDYFDQTLAGHFHTTQFFGENKNGLYLGSPLHLNFGDCVRTPVVWIIDIYKNKKIELNPIEIRTPIFHSFEDLNIKNVNPGDYVEFKIEATYQEWIQKLDEIKKICKDLKSKDITAVYKHKLIYHHKNRLNKNDSNDYDFSNYKQIINDYIDNDNVVTTGLSVNKLKKIGIEILKKVNF